MAPITLDNADLTSGQTHVVDGNKLHAWELVLPAQKLLEFNNIKTKLRPVMNFAGATDANNALQRTKLFTTSFKSNSQITAAPRSDSAAG